MYLLGMHPCKAWAPVEQSTCIASPEQPRQVGLPIVDEGDPKSTGPHSRMRHTYLAIAKGKDGVQ